MSKTLVCPGPPKHFFQHKGGRGRPPKYCDEHKPQKKRELVTDVTVTEELASNPFVKKAQVAAQKERKPKREKAKRVERVPDKLEDLEQEYLEIDTQIAKAKAEYDETFKTANSIGTGKDVDFADIESEFNKAWHSCDVKMNALIQTLARKRQIEKRVEELTNPNYKPEPTTIDHGVISSIVVENEDDAIAIQNAAANDQAIEEELEPEDIGELEFEEEDDTADRFAAILEEFEE